MSLAPAPARILIVDDNEANLIAFSAMLTGACDELVTARSGQEALVRAQEGELAAILLDLMMPGMSGIETLEHLREKGNQTPILLITASFPNPDLITKGYALGVADYLHKPIAPEILSAKISVFVDLFRKASSIRQMEEERFLLQLREEKAQWEARTQALIARQNARLYEESKEAHKQLERSMAELERCNAELRQFGHIISHDLKEPLRTINSFAHLLQRRLGDQADEETKEFLTLMSDAAQRMSALLDSLLKVALLEASEKDFKSVDCNEVVDDILKDLHLTVSEAGAKVTRDEMPAICADRAQIYQLFQNLIRNGLKFHNGKRPEIQVAAEQKDGQIVFSVRDNGIGIAPEDKERIFGMFQRLHTRDQYPGTGVGLALCKKIVELHGGKIWVESTPGAGSTFYFTTPVSQ